MAPIKNLNNVLSKIDKSYPRGWHDEIFFDTAEKKLHFGGFCDQNSWTAGHPDSWVHVGNFSGRPSAQKMRAYVLTALEMARDYHTWRAEMRADAGQVDCAAGEAARADEISAAINYLNS